MVWVKMIAPKPFKYKCPYCRYTKIVKPKSDVLNPLDMISSCPKCKNEMHTISLTIFDKLFKV